MVCCNHSTLISWDTAIMVGCFNGRLLFMVDHFLWLAGIMVGFYHILQSEKFAIMLQYCHGSLLLW